MKTKVGEYKGKVIVEGGENPQNELKPHEMLFPSSDSEVQIFDIDLGEVKNSFSITPITDSQNREIDVVVAVIPGSPIKGEVEDNPYSARVSKSTLTFDKDGYLLVFCVATSGTVFDTTKLCLMKIVETEAELDLPENKTDDTVVYQTGTYGKIVTYPKENN